jgi:hypothetical protein
MMLEELLVASEAVGRRNDKYRDAHPMA